MDDFRAISAIASLETAKIKRAARKGKLTRLTKKLEEYAHTPLQEQNVSKLNKT